MTVFVFRDKNLPLNREVRSSMTTIYGIGIKKAKFIADRLGFIYPFKAQYLTAYHKVLLSGILNKVLTTDIKAKRIRAVNIKILKEINSLKGRKHSFGLPVRGQRIKTNGQSQKKVAGSDRKKNVNLKSLRPKSDSYWRKKSQWKRRGRAYKRKK